MSKLATNNRYGGNPTWTELLLEVRAGEGGQDAKLFASELFKTYNSYLRKLSEKNKIEWSQVSDNPLTLHISGKDINKYFKLESGKHCVQRYSGKKRHTSMVSVSIVPVIKMSLEVNEDEFQIKTQRGHGKGGQHQNKTDSAVRMRHIPTGLEVFINGRSQNRNKDLAYSILIEKIKELKEQSVSEKVDSIRKKQVNGGNRSNKIRTYNFIDGSIIDHNTGKMFSKINKIMKGDLEVFYI